VKLARINTLLVLAIILVNAYVILTPFAPGVLFWLERNHSATLTHLNAQLHSPAASAGESNQLIIPSMLATLPINEGKDMRALANGPWRLPYTSTPDKGSNTVIVGHRFTYTNPRGAFYQLDKIHRGDDIGVYWQGKKYLYKVTETAIVPPTQLSVEAPTSDSRLTLYTCTPLWWPKDRLVVTARLEQNP
jgi:sortase A